MAALTFDTLKFANRLKAAGVPSNQAEAEAEALSDVLAEAVNTADLATKSDLVEMKYDLLKWIIGLAMAQFALIIGVLMKMPH